MIASAEDRKQFLADYTKIRHEEGRGSETPEYYRALPYVDLTGRNSAQWRIRARTFEFFKRRILPSRTCEVLDLGAGNCWLSYRLAQLRHAPVAADIFNDTRDGMRAARHYPVRFPVVEADFDSLPFRSASFDLAVFNSSIHYSSDYARTLTEARRCLRADGRVVILDSPVYRRREHGEAMRAERREFFERQYGTRSEALSSVEFLDMDMLNALSRELGVSWTIHRPWYGWEWHLRPLRARLKGRRPPSRFWILVGAFQ